MALHTYRKENGCLKTNKPTKKLSRHNNIVLYDYHMITFYIMNTDLALVQDKVSKVSPQCSDIIVQMAFVLWLLIWLKTNENQTITHLVLVYNVILNGMISNF